MGFCAIGLIALSMSCRPLSEFFESSCEDRIRAAKLYIKLGKRLGATIRQLGYPTKNSLIGWYRLDSDEG